MKSTEKYELECLLLDRLSGKLRVLQGNTEREQIGVNELSYILKEDDGKHFREAKDELVSDEAKSRFCKGFFELGTIHDLMQDLNVEDVIVNALNPVYIHHSQKGFVETDKKFESFDELNLFIKKLVIFSGRTIVENLMNIELPNLLGRVNIVKSPFGPQLTITKAKVSPISIIDLVKHGSMTYEVAAQLWLYMEGMSIRPANMIVAGGPGVGKTTLLNALFSFVPDTSRMVVIEDTLELNTEFAESCSRLESGEDFDLAELVQNSLRMRPERIVVGEVRGAEARDMITAVNIGKYCIGTIHALTSREAVMRMQNEPMNIPRELIRLIDVFVILKRYHVDEKIYRMVDEISETGAMEQDKVLLAQIYKYDYESNTIKAVTTSTIYRDKLAQQAGLSPKDIMVEVQLRAFLLEELAKKGHTTIKEVTAFCSAYSRNPDKAVTNLGFDRKELIGKK